MTVKQGNVIKLHYTGRMEDGEEFDTSHGREPIEFRVGEEQVIKGIDEGVVGLEPGQHTEITVPPEKGFGEHRPELVRTVSRDVLQGQEVSPGEIVELLTADGQLVLAKVIDITADAVTLDLNHPLAGRTLRFDVEVTDIAA